MKKIEPTMIKRKQREKACKDYSNYACYVFLRHLPHTMTPGKAAAQAHHAGTHLAFHYKDHEDVKGYLDQAIGFGTTLIMKPKNPRNSDEQIQKIIAYAGAMGLVCGTVRDTSYPVDYELTCNILTSGYILLDRRNKNMLPLLNEWELY